MSIASCKNCGQFVDTDDEPESYSITLESGKEILLDYCLCVHCRENLDIQDKIERQHQLITKGV